MLTAGVSKSVSNAFCGIATEREGRMNLIPCLFPVQANEAQS